jgi:hypothetical protein
MTNDWTVDDLLAALPDEDDYPIAGGATLRASWAGSCERVVSYRVRGVEPSDMLPLTVRLAFAVGRAVHDVVQAGLGVLYPKGEAEKEGVLESNTRTWRPFPLVGFHADFWRPGGGGTVTEIKTMQTFALFKARKEGVQPWHLAQAGIAALGLSASVVEIVYVDKAKGDMDVYRFPWDEFAPVARHAVHSMMRAATAELGERIDPDRQHWRCRNCEFYTRCGQDG